MKSEEMLALATRCERASGPDDAIDLAIAELGYHSGGLFGVNYDPRLWVERYCWEPTASIDSAMVLVDARALWAHGSMEEGPFARLCWPMPDGSYLNGYHEARAATVPLSICAAALRARAQSPEQLKGEGR